MIAYENLKMKALFCLLSLCQISLSYTWKANNVHDAGDTLKEHDISVWKRACAFYRWSFCPYPGKKEVDGEASIEDSYLQKMYKFNNMLRSFT